MVAYGHHPPETMGNPVPDEYAGPCRGVALGCDHDPRSSAPIHLGLRGSASIRSLFLRFPNVVLYVPGHVHHNRVRGHFRRGSGFWQITTASHMSYPQQTRLIELMENGDGTSSIIGTVLGTAAPTGVPPSGTHASAMSDTELASISRLLAASVRGAPSPAQWPQAAGGPARPGTSSW